ncbi:DUF2141 domain-containing protein [Paraurantiacibacter namhicola]|uniref:DUF2141 domain-containing protein n=1 Tax=Paraurantiacibacter namhicola TaxID=645517 RepID=A0A1C7D5T8_9SPHN|nr:DUF2141 domain-containing protein [Paraurantiacibacter namhicola]ANU06825.1 hypothetical protein A6F65_00500 [Paraurantiacibacter namhicola]
MRHGSRTVPALTVAACALALGGAAPAPVKPAGTDVTVSVVDIRAAKGSVRACLTPDPKAFPKCDGDDRAQELAVSADGKSAKLVFRNVRPGTYAISLLHDENDNGKIDTALGMMPKEGYGFSRDAKVSMGPPKFHKAAFEVGEKPVSQTIRVRYFL